MHDSCEGRCDTDNHDRSMIAAKADAILRITKKERPNISIMIHIIPSHIIENKEIRKDTIISWQEHIQSKKHLKPVA